MGEKGAKDQGSTPLACSVCMKEIPGDVDYTAEGHEYVFHFCGLDCYRKWHERKAVESSNAKAE